MATGTKTVQYKLCIYKSIGDFVHGMGTTITEFYVPALKVTYNRGEKDAGFNVFKGRRDAVLDEDGRLLPGVKDEDLSDLKEGPTLTDEQVAALTAFVQAQEDYEQARATVSALLFA